MLEYSEMHKPTANAPTAEAANPQTKLELPPLVKAWAAADDTASHVTLVQNDMNSSDQTLKFRSSLEVAPLPMSVTRLSLLLAVLITMSSADLFLSTEVPSVRSSLAMMVVGFDKYERRDSEQV
jgi:hypothetical protein